MISDEELVLYRRIKVNDRKALEHLFRRYYSSLCQFALPIVKRPEIAEELVADIFFILWRDRHHLEITHSIKAYLFKSVRNKAIGIYNKRQPVFEEITEHSNQMTVNHTPESDYLLSELDGRYQSAIETLPQKCKLIFKLHKIEGLKYSEVSEVLDISIKTVENQMTKALKILRSAISQYQVEQH